ncbi:MAG: DUF255 domain-containing protein [Actinobacteria bacterium]|uniref:Unannotated protein n=2 Tax=freshwater metagenome TaxID=449393 RepID=A0A6J7F0X7_9ZZZZ|nr:DUF255 domain-containing protein [Actinomycetota bacterium]
MNRLADESSPYLRQHADNPVDWYPWGAEAFERAHAENKPIFLSVGYSSCHWCHVMAHESFEDGPTATIMNRLFVNVKVDREERPDVDGIYMDAVQAFTGRGGWPMSVFLAPDGRPFFGGTYFPSSPRHGMPSFVQLLENVHDVWLHQRDEILEQADRITEAITQQTRIVAADSLPGLEVLFDAGAALRKQHDAAWGGFGGAPKFPQTMSHEALLRLFAHTGDDDLLRIVTGSLDAMASGGIYDHLAGGFARYSVDAQWTVPHFEKMLYDNALLARLYLHAWQITGKQRYLQVCSETIEYVLRDMTHASGGFYSAEDADSEGEEGKFAVWSIDEVRSVLTEAGLAAHVDDAIEWYGITEGGNFEGHNILVRSLRGDLVRPPHIEACREALYAHRLERPKPGLDDKVLTEWNGLMLATLAEAAAATGNERWLAAARANATFLCDQLLVDGRWFRSWQADSGARHLAYAADHAAVVDSFLRLAEATGEARWTHTAMQTADAMLKLFWDDENGGLFSTGTDAERLFTRPKDILDNATPSANSLAAVALLRLAALTGLEHHRARAADILRLVGTVAANQPTAFGNALAAIDLLVSGVTEIVVSGEHPDLVAVASSMYLPNAVLAWGEPYDSPLWEGRSAAAAYVCREYSCLAPTTDPTVLRSLLTRPS